MKILILAIYVLNFGCANLKNKIFGETESNSQLYQEQNTQEQSSLEQTVSIVSPSIITNDKFYGYEFGKKLTIKGKLIRKGIDEKSNCPRVSYEDPKKIFDSLIFVLCKNNLVKISLLKQRGDFEHIYNASRDKIYEDYPRDLVFEKNFLDNNPPLATTEVNLLKDETEWSSKFRTFQLRCENRFYSQNNNCDKFNFAIGRVISKIWLVKRDVVFLDVTTHEYDKQVEEYNNQVKRKFDL